MGKLGNAFQREIGRNTGKFVSNLLFGDKHSTPYRRVDGGGSSSVRAEAAAFALKQHKPEQKQQEYRPLHLKKKQVQRLKNKRKTI